MTAGVANQNGDNILDRDTSGAASGGITNEPAFPNDNATGPQGQGNSYDWDGLLAADDGAGGSGGVSQYAHIAAGEDRLMAPSAGLPEQAYAKPTDSPSPAALGPGMRSR